MKHVSPIPALACAVLAGLSAVPGADRLYAAGGRLLIASFSTSIADQDENVKRNITLACNRLDGVQIPAGKIFSFNDTVGEGSARNGFAPGRVLYRDRVVMEPGGGLCQVSSTLFNSLLMAGCMIIERHRHYQPVSYVPPGLDATIKYGRKDLRVKNPHSSPIKIETRMNDKSLIVAITSEQVPPCRYEIVTEEEETAVPAGGYADSVRQGISVYVYRKRFRGNELLDTALLYRDYYPPVQVR